jgi:HNH endonuclease
MTSCEICNFSFRAQDSSRLHKHHIRPIAHGGDDIASNLILLCPNCHCIAHILLDSYIGGGLDVYKLYDRQYFVLQVMRYNKAPNPLQMLLRALKALYQDRWLKLKISWRKHEQPKGRI